MCTGLAIARIYHKAWWGEGVNQLNIESLALVTVKLTRAVKLTWVLTCT